MMHSVVLARRPHGNPVETDFAVREAPLPKVSEGSFLTRNTYVSLLSLIHISEPTRP